MDDDNRYKLLEFLNTLPGVEFSCIYGSYLHPKHNDKLSMLDFIICVRDPLKWHSENLKVNRDHYSSSILRMGGAKLITSVADRIGVGVHFNPYVTFKGKIMKYGVVGVSDLIQDIMKWERLYVSGRLQKPVRILVDNISIENLNLINLKAAISAALLLLPFKFTEEELYTRICGLSYDGDLRMFFAEDRYKVKKIVCGQFNLFRGMYKQFLEEYIAQDLLTFSHSSSQTYLQDMSPSSTQVLISSLPSTIQMWKRDTEYGCCRDVVAKGMQKSLRRIVAISSCRQAFSGFISAGVVNSVTYFARKVGKSWKSRMHI